MRLADLLRQGKPRRPAATGSGRAHTGPASRQRPPIVLEAARPVQRRAPPPSRLPLAGAPAAGAGAGNCRHASACLGSSGAFIGSRAPGGNRMNWKWPAEFRDFALKGNVVDLAVGVIIG